PPQSSVLCALFLSGPLPWFLNHRHMLKTHGIGPAGEIAFQIVRKKQRALENPQPPHQIDLKRWRQRISLPAGSRNLPAALRQSRVIDGQNHDLLRISTQIFFSHSVKQFSRLPRTTREQFVVWHSSLVRCAPPHRWFARRSYDQMPRATAQHARWHVAVSEPGEILPSNSDPTSCDSWPAAYSYAFPQSEDVLIRPYETVLPLHLFHQR